MKQLYVPYYPTLSIEKILQFAWQFERVRGFLPASRDIPMLPRQVSFLVYNICAPPSDLVFCVVQWIINVCYCVIGNPFSDFIRERVNERNESLAERRDLNVEIDAEFLDVIRASSAVSTTKGNSAMLCKVGSKRRRTKAEMDEFKSLQENQF